MSDIPHFDYPFRFVNGHARCVEQDSADEIANAALAVLKTPPGFRAELPDFGCPEQALRWRSAPRDCSMRWRPSIASFRRALG